MIVLVIVQRPWIPPRLLISPRGGAGFFWLVGSNAICTTKTRLRLPPPRRETKCVCGFAQFSRVPLSEAGWARTRDHPPPAPPLNVPSSFSHRVNLYWALMLSHSRLSRYYLNRVTFRDFSDALYDQTTNYACELFHA